MLCDICHHNEANIIFQVFQNGRMTTHPVCAECAMKAQREFLRALEKMGTAAQQDMEEQPAALPKRLCPVCGTAVDEIGRDTVLGCPHCYQSAFEQVAALREGVQPVKDEEESDMAHRLREALASEDYEQAARLRDMLKDAEGGGKAEDGQTDR